jgi:RHS repeat-associated protein
VLATISDKKFGVTSGGSSLIDHFEPDIVTAQDYYPFGMISREALPSGNVPYKFGFNGKLNDNDVKGGYGLQQDYGMRIYDNRVGRFLSVDPITKQYPMLTPYQFASNTPIQAIDMDGLEMVSPSAYSEDKQPMQGVQKAAGTAASVMNRVDRVNPWNVSEERMNQNEQATGALVHAVANPTQTVKNIKKSIVNWKNQLVYGDPETSGRAFGSFLGVVGDVVMIKGLGSSLLANYEGNQIINKMLKDGVKIIVATSEDDINYLKSIGGQALYMSGNAGKVLPYW